MYRKIGWCVTYHPFSLVALLRALVSTGWRLLSVVKNALILLLFYSSTSLFFIFTHEAYMDRSLNEKKKKVSGEIKTGYLHTEALPGLWGALWWRATHLFRPCGDLQHVVYLNPWAFSFSPSSGKNKTQSLALRSRWATAECRKPQANKLA